jgi:hypothetical protein
MILGTTRTRAAHLPFLLTALTMATTTGCGSSAASPADAAVDALPGTGGAAGQDGAGGTAGSNGGNGWGADAAVDGAASCMDLACLTAAASVIAPCKPDNACTYQLGATTRCFTNGVTIKQTDVNVTTTNPGGQIIMTVEKGGALCYSLEITYADATHSAATLVYKDASGTPIVTEYADNNTTTVTCPGAVAVPVSLGGSCDTALAALGALTPASSCAYATQVAQGGCVF